MIYISTLRPCLVMCKNRNGPLNSSGFQTDKYFTIKHRGYGLLLLNYIGLFFRNIELSISLLLTVINKRMQQILSYVSVSKAVVVFTNLSYQNIERYIISLRSNNTYLSTLTTQM